MGVVTLFPGGKKPNLASIAIAVNGVYDAENAGYDGYNHIEVNVLPNVNEKYITSNGIYRAATEGYDGYNVVNVNVVPNLVDLTVTRNGLYEHTGYDGYNMVNVQVPASTFARETFTANGIYNAQAYGVNGFNEVNVAVPANTFMKKTITANGTYNALQLDNVNGYNEVVVAVPTLLTQDITFTRNGTYTAPTGYGYKNVNVDVPAPNLMDLTVYDKGVYTPDMYGSYDGFSSVNVQVTDESWKEYVPLVNGAYSNDLCYRFYPGHVQQSGTVKIGNMINNCANMFRDLSTFNAAVIIGEGVWTCINMFYNCTLFNRPVTVPNNVRSCQWMFAHASNFDSSVTFGDNVAQLSYAFYQSNLSGVYGDFSSKIKLPEKATNYAFAFSQCNRFQYVTNLTFPNNAQNFTSAFAAYYTGGVWVGYRALGGNIYILNSAPIVRNMLNGRTTSPAPTRLNIYVTNMAPFRNTNAADSLVGATITWYGEGYNIYNTAYNLYIYNYLT